VRASSLGSTTPATFATSALPSSTGIVWCESWRSPKSPERFRRHWCVPL
jgi:hypothetical protein